jgi:chaperonin GroES
MAFRLLGARIAVEPEPAPVTSGCILIPEQAQEARRRGTVVQVGPGKRDPVSGRHVPLDVRVGDRVLFTRFAPHEVTLDGRAVWIMDESDVQATILGDADLRTESR